MYAQEVNNWVIFAVFILGSDHIILKYYSWLSTQGLLLVVLEEYICYHTYNMAPAIELGKAKYKVNSLTSKLYLILICENYFFADFCMFNFTLIQATHPIPKSESEQELCKNQDFSLNSAIKKCAKPGAGIIAQQ